MRLAKVELFLLGHLTAVVTCMAHDHPAESAAHPPQGPFTKAMEPLEEFAFQVHREVGTKPGEIVVPKGDGQLALGEPCQWFADKGLIIVVVYCYYFVQCNWMGAQLFSFPWVGAGG